jgi:hypothetical protein
MPTSLASTGEKKVVCVSGVGKKGKRESNEVETLELKLCFLNLATRWQTQNYSARNLH